MLQKLAITAGLLLLVGCQNNTAPEYVSAPSMTAPQILTSPTETPYRPNNPPTVQGQQPQPQPQPKHIIPAHPQITGAKAWAPPGAPHAWRWIVIHHSDTKVGSAMSFDRYHRSKGWDELGYHFVVGNGTGSGDGQVEVGSRWTKQKVGAHAGVKLYNEDGIGVCLVGNFAETRPTSAQIQATARLVAYLMKTYRIPADRVIGHRDVPPPHTKCPGRYFDVAAVRHLAATMAGMNDASPATEKLASRELLLDLPK